MTFLVNEQVLNLKDSDKVTGKWKRISDLDGQPIIVAHPTVIVTDQDILNIFQRFGVSLVTGFGAEWGIKKDGDQIPSEDHPDLSIIALYPPNEDDLVGCDEYHQDAEEWYFAETNYVKQRLIETLEDAIKKLKE